MSLPKNEAWFPAKRYGFGWGFPSRWQGWAVLVGFLAAVMVPTLLLPASSLGPTYVAYVVFLTLFLLAICVWKGEKPRWRWGDEPDEGGGGSRRS